MERSQNIRYATNRRVGTNYTLSGIPIKGGFSIEAGSPEFFKCGCEKAPGIDSCSCGRS